MGISIHRPLAGPDAVADTIVENTTISIHRPLAGPDRLKRYKAESEEYFNPQAPRGARLLLPLL